MRLTLADTPREPAGHNWTGPGSRVASAGHGVAGSGSCIVDNGEAVTIRCRNGSPVTASAAGTVGEPGTGDLPHAKSWPSALSVR